MGCPLQDTERGENDLSHYRAARISSKQEFGLSICSKISCNAIAYRLSFGCIDSLRLCRHLLACLFRRCLVGVFDRLFIHSFALLACFKCMHEFT